MYRLHGFCQSGNTFKVAFLLRALKQPWEAVFVDYMRGITRDAQWREATNEMGEAHLESRPFIVGGAPTIADFSLCGYLFYPIEESGYEVESRYPRISSWLSRVKALPGWAHPYEVPPGERISAKW